MRNILISSLLAAVIISASCTASYADSFQSYLEEGKAQVAARNYQAAADALGRALEVDANSAEARMYLGIALLRLKDYDNAEFNLLRALEADPENPRLNLELGRLYAETGVYTEALDFYETVSDLAPGSSLDLEARRQMQRTAVPPAVKSWAADIALGLQYDDNVILIPDSAPMPQGISDKADSRLTISAGLNYFFAKGKRKNAYAGYSLYQSMHSDLGEFDVTTHTLSLGGTMPLTGSTSFIGRLAYDAVSIDGESYSSGFAISPSVAIEFGQGKVMTISLDYKDTAFENSAAFTDNAERDGSTTSIGLSQSLPVGESMNMVLGMFSESASADKDYHAYGGTRLFGNVSKSLPREFELNLYAERQDRDFDRINPKFMAKREDGTTTVALSLKKKFSDRYGLTCSQLHSTNDSNISLLEYDRNVTSVVFKARF